MRNRTFLLAIGLFAVLLTGAGGLYLYDYSREDVIAKGVSVNGIDLGGLTPERARVKLRRSFVGELQAPIVVKAGRERFRLTPRRARVRINVDAMVGEALSRSRDGNVLSRTWRQLTGEEAHANLSPRLVYSQRVVDRFVAKVRREVNRPPRDATIQPSSAELSRIRSRSGLTLQTRALRRDLAGALGSLGEDRTIRGSIKRIEPAVTTRELGEKYPTYLTIDRSNFRLRLYKNLKLKKSYPIALGAAGRETPAGLYDIQNKQVDPVWSVPNSDWAGALAGQQIPPGPNNPLKARWLGIYNGVGIHGTAERQSIGTNASKGCIRMLVEDVVELYPRVPVGTPVYIA
jgi:hypothetical protein